eukprot:Skav205981  [mRNA]  locus=scaffold442:982260:983067:+ [translate_table: standard]
MLGPLAQHRLRQKKRIATKLSYVRQLNPSELRISLQFSALVNAISVIYSPFSARNIRAFRSIVTRALARAARACADSREDLRSWTRFKNLGPSTFKQPAMLAGTRARKVLDQSWMEANIWLYPMMSRFVKTSRAMASSSAIFSFSGHPAAAPGAPLVAWLALLRWAMSSRNRCWARSVSTAEGAEAEGAPARNQVA